LSDRLVVKAVLSLSLCLGGRAFAGIIAANNAGALPASAEDLSLLFPTEITGTLDFPNGVSMFKIELSAPVFSAITVLPPAHGVPDTELFLFDSTGVGVYMNDEMTFSNTQSCLPSLAGNPCPSVRNGVGPASDGVYYLAITRSANLPVGAHGELFAPLLSTDVAGPVLNDPITGWDGAVNTSPNFDQINYDIILQGAVPEPPLWMVTAGAVLVFILLRRRFVPTSGPMTGPG
jgi:hypothetical protein